MVHKIASRLPTDERKANDSSMQVAVFLSVLIFLTNLKFAHSNIAPESPHPALISLFPLFSSVSPPTSASFSTNFSGSALGSKTKYAFCFIQSSSVGLTSCISKLKTIFESITLASARKTLRRRRRGGGDTVLVTSRPRAMPTFHRTREDLLAAHTIPRPNRKGLECLLVILVESGVVPRVALGEEAFGVEDSRFDPVGCGVLDVL